MATAKQLILQAALACFDDKGYEATTTSAICTASGVSNGSLFHHFGSKEGIASALFLSALVSYHEALLSGLQPDMSAEDGIEYMISSHISWVVEHRVEAQFLFEQARAEWLSSISVAQKQENQRFAEGISQWRDPLITAKKIRPVVREIFFSQLIGPAQLMVRRWLTAKDNQDLRLQIPVLNECAARALLV